MSIERYLNIDGINANLENEGKIISDNDLFVFFKNEKENNLIETPIIAFTGDEDEEKIQGFYRYC